MSIRRDTCDTGSPERRRRVTSDRTPGGPKRGRARNGPETGTRARNGDAARFNRLPRPARRQEWSGRPEFRLRSESLPLTGTHAKPELSRVAHHHPRLSGVMSSPGIYLLRSDRPKQPRIKRLRVVGPTCADDPDGEFARSDRVASQELMPLVRPAIAGGPENDVRDDERRRADAIDLRPTAKGRDNSRKADCSPGLAYSTKRRRGRSPSGRGRSRGSWRGRGG
jgi:hypothetical protein